MSKRKGHYTKVRTDTKNVHVIVHLTVRKISAHPPGSTSKRILTFDAQCSPVSGSASHPSFPSTSSRKPGKRPPTVNDSKEPSKPRRLGEKGIRESLHQVMCTLCPRPMTVTCFNHQGAIGSSVSLHEGQKQIVQNESRDRLNPSKTKRRTIN